MCVCVFTKNRDGKEEVNKKDFVFKIKKRESRQHTNSQIASVRKQPPKLSVQY